MYNYTIIKPAVSQLSYCAITFIDQVKHYLDIWQGKETYVHANQQCVVPEKLDLDFWADYLGTVMN